MRRSIGRSGRTLGGRGSLAGAVAWATLGLACGTEARGIAECRFLEEARCRAAGQCGFDAAACQRFAREQCLHGLLSAVPTDAELRDCYGALEAAEACLTEFGRDAEPDQCESRLEASNVDTVCEAVERPETLAACALFAVPAPDADEPATTEPEESADAGAS